jgi:hypothetical protein
MWGLDSVVGLTAWFSAWFSVWHVHQQSPTGQGMRSRAQIWPPAGDVVVLLLVISSILCFVVSYVLYPTQKVAIPALRRVLRNTVLAEHLVVRARPRGHVRVTGGLGRAHSAGKSTVDHDEWLQVGLEVVI